MAFCVRHTLLIQAPDISEWVACRTPTAAWMTQCASESSVFGFSDAFRELSGQQFIDAVAAADNGYRASQRRCVDLVRIHTHQMEDRAEQVLNPVRMRCRKTGRGIAGTNHSASLNSAAGHNHSLTL